MNIPPSTYNVPHSASSMPHRGYDIPQSTCVAHTEAAIARTALAIVPIAAAKSHTEDPTTQTEAITFHMHPFESTVTTNEKIAKPFLSLIVGLKVSVL